MDPDRYDIVFSGQLLEGFDAALVSDNLTRLFKSPPETIAKLMGGATVVVKRDADLDTARKYLVAMHKAGALATMRPSGSVSAATTATAPAPAAAPVAAPSTGPATGATEPSSVGAAPARSAERAELSLAPPGSDVLREEERRRVDAVDVATDHIRLASVFDTVDANTLSHAPPPPDTSHISIAEPGADLLADKPPPSAPPAPDTSGFDLAEPGARIGPEDTVIPLPLPDLSALSLAPPGAPLEQLRADRAPVNPDIRHLSLLDNTP